MHTGEDTRFCVDSFTFPTAATFKVLAANKYEAQMRYHNELIKHKRYKTFIAAKFVKVTNKVNQTERQLLPLKQVV